MMFQAEGVTQDELIDIIKYKVPIKILQIKNT